MCLCPTFIEIDVICFCVVSCRIHIRIPCSCSSFTGDKHSFLACYFLLFFFSLKLVFRQALYSFVQEKIIETFQASQSNRSFIWLRSPRVMMVFFLMSTLTLVFSLKNQNQHLLLSWEGDLRSYIKSIRFA